MTLPQLHRLHNIKWDNNCEWQIRKNVEGSNHCLS